MKRTALLLLTCIIVNGIFAQTALTSADWQSDLRFLQETVHKDYSFLFKKTTAEKFDASVEKLYQEIPKLQPHEIVAGFGRIVSSFEYGHTDIGWRETPVKFHVLPINLYWFSDGVYIEGAHKDYEKVVGAKVLKIEGMPVEEALKAVRPLVPAENDQYFKAYSLDFLAVPEALHAQKITNTLKSAITLTLERDGKSFDHTITAVESYNARKMLKQINGD